MRRLVEKEVLAAAAAWPPDSLLNLRARALSLTLSDATRRPCSQPVTRFVYPSGADPTNGLVVAPIERFRTFQRDAGVGASASPICQMQAMVSRARP